MLWAAQMAEASDSSPQLCAQQKSKRARERERERECVRERVSERERV